MSSQLVEYIKLHRLSLQQDFDVALMGDGYSELISQISVLNHILEYANELDLSRPNMVG